MRRLFDLRRPISTRAYAFAMTAIYLLQPLYVLAAVGVSGRPLSISWVFWFLPFRELARIPGMAAPWLAGGLILSLAVAVSLAAVSFRRVKKVGIGGGLAAASILPFIQIVAFAWLVVAPFVHPPSAPVEPKQHARWLAVTQGILAGTGLIVFAVAIGTLMFGAYGFGLFIASPFLVGLTTGFLVNRSEALERGGTAIWVATAAALGGVMLLMFGLEGGICMIMATPITATMALAGGWIGRELILAGHRRARPTLMSFAILPLAFAVESVSPPDLVMWTLEEIEVAAPATVVWAALVDQGDINPAPSLPFRLGLSHPIRSSLKGTGIGATRHGVFSTGISVERITDWQPGRRLAFEVLTNPPAMRELSPRATVNAPHVSGYFETAETSFELEALSGGRTRLIERSRHTLRLDPALYWEPLARWAIHQNAARVMAHIKHQAEATSSPQTVARAPPSPARRENAVTSP